MLNPSAIIVTIVGGIMTGVLLEPQVLKESRVVRLSELETVIGGCTNQVDSMINCTMNDVNNPPNFIQCPIGGCQLAQGINQVFCKGATSSQPHVCKDQANSGTDCAQANAGNCGTIQTGPQDKNGNCGGQCANNAGGCGAGQSTTTITKCPS